MKRKSLFEISPRLRGVHKINNELEKNSATIKIII